MPLWVKKGSMKFPKDPYSPVIMVGPGTGVAPFRSALQERIAQGKTGELPLDWLYPPLTTPVPCYFRFSLSHFILSFS